MRQTRMKPLSDVTCATCGEPWDTYHLRHDEVHETVAGQERLEDKLDIEDWEKRCQWLDLFGREATKTKPQPQYRGEPWKGKLTDFWRKQFAARGWEFGVSIYAVMKCPSCKYAEPCSDADSRIEAREVIGELLEGDEDGIAVTIEDLG